MKFDAPRHVTIDLGDAYRARIVTLAADDAVTAFAADAGYETRAEYDVTYRMLDGAPAWTRDTAYFTVRRQEYMDVAGFKLRVPMAWDEEITTVPLDALEPDIPQHRVSYPPRNELKAFTTHLYDALDDWHDFNPDV